MMINKRLIGAVKESKKYIAGNVICQWVSLAANIAMMGAIAHLLQNLYVGNQDGFGITAVIAAIALVIRFVCATASSRMGYLSSKAVKKTLREIIYRKLLRLGASYKEQANTSEVVQVAVEGVDQLETYFGAYLPQFFYAMLAPLTLFVVLSFVNFPSAIVLLVCVPLIPVTIVAVQRWAKKLLAKYWGQYTALGDTFLENLQGLTTTKIYQADEFKHQEMNEQSEHFRRITMKVLTMQLNSITIMDLIAYGGAALGVILATTQFKAGHVDLAGCLMIILLAADFFLPMRMLGSFFHIAMNGMAASDKIFRLLDLPEPEQKTAVVPEDCSIECNNLRFSYEADREILHDVDMAFPKGSFTAIVGESGCGKSTMASILMGRNKDYSGELTVGGTPLSEISEASLMENFTYISHQSYLFKGNVRENLLMARPNAGEDTLWQVLEQVNLADFLRSEKGLDTILNEKGSNLSGGQCQRLALARALLHDSPVYIFDEATSNIDVESENDIMAQIHALAKSKTVILISHRLANVVGADNIYVLDHSTVVENGTHSELLARNGTYAKLWNAQQELEHYTSNDVIPSEARSAKSRDLGIDSTAYANKVRRSFDSLRSLRMTASEELNGGAQA
ncbi:MAG: ABC transporter ATP-binding protein/permease [Oscillospiraceae bacterium]|nr:ABC transporter ATP-binding protein/permease [Oscillospiraceae bacterium]